MITLYLMGQKGLAVITKLNEEGLLGTIDAVVVSNDINMQDDYYSDIRDFCIKNNLTIYNRNDSYSNKSKYSIAVAWRWIIDSYTKLIVLHDSLLPKYRGFAPLVNMLLHREPYIGVTALFASPLFDSGDIIAQKSQKVHYPIKINDAIELLLPLYAELSCNIVKKIQSGIEINAQPQNEEEASYSLWRDDEDYLIDWNASASYIQQFVYSVGHPYKGASCKCNGQMVRVIDCEVKKDVSIENRQVGKVLFVEDGFPVVVCGEGLLKLTEVVTEDEKSILPLKRFRSRFC